MPHNIAGRSKWQVGKTYAVQPGRGKKSIGRIRLTAIRREDVRNISAEDVKAEGFHTRLNFIRVWAQMHDKLAYEDYLADCVDNYMERPAHLYDAWVLEFELVKSEKE